MRPNPLFGFLKTDYANPGAMNYAFSPNTTLPALGVGGAASLVLDNLRVLQPRQVMVQVTVPTDGYGGLVAGQFISQPLEG